MEQVQIQVLESPRLKQCNICAIQECKKCVQEIKRERIRKALFIGVSGVSMIGLSFVSTSFIGLGLTCGTIVSLFYSL